MGRASTPTQDPGTAMGSGGARRRRRGLRAFVTAGVAFSSLLAVVGVGVGTSGPAAAAGPACTFNGSPVQLVSNVKAGGAVNVVCSGLPASTTFVQVELSLTAAIDPNSSAILTGASVTSLSGLLALINTTPELNALSVALTSSNASGGLNTTYTIPTTQPLDPNSTCPPTKEELNSGLIGCAVAMINATTFKPVTVGTFVTVYAGDPLLPPAPTMSFTPAVAKSGHTVQVSDKPGATTYWWLATLASLEALLSGGSPPKSFPVTITGIPRAKKTAHVVAAPASYDNQTLTFTPPKLSGTIVANGHGKRKITATLSANLLGLSTFIQAITKLTIVKTASTAALRQSAARVHHHRR